MLISLGIGLEKFDGQMHRIDTHIHSSIISRNKIFGDLVNNIDYIRQQNNELIGKLGQNNSQSISILSDDVRKLHSKYNKIRKTLEELKHLIFT